MIVRLDLESKNTAKRTEIVDEQPTDFLYLQVEFIAGDICPSYVLKVKWPVTKAEIVNAIETKLQALETELAQKETEQQEKDDIMGQIALLFDNNLMFNVDVI